MHAVRPSPYTPFSLSVVPNREEVAVVPVGELDLASAPRVAAAVAELCADGFDAIVLDLGQVEFIDSAGLQMLLGMREEAERQGHSLMLVSPPRTARRVFDLTGTDALFEWRGPGP
jgi:anti-sigma B factor antagonist